MLNSQIFFQAKSRIYACLSFCVYIVYLLAFVQWVSSWSLQFEFTDFLRISCWTCWVCVWVCLYAYIGASQGNSELSSLDYWCRVAFLLSITQGHLFVPYSRLWAYFPCSFDKHSLLRGKTSWLPLPITILPELSVSFGEEVLRKIEAKKSSSSSSWCRSKYGFCYFADSSSMQVVSPWNLSIFWSCSTFGIPIRIH